MEEFKITKDQQIITVEAEKNVIPDKSGIRKLVIKGWFAIGCIIAFIGFLITISIEDGMKYFGNSITQSVLMLVGGIGFIMLGAYMCVDARKHLNH